MPTKKVNTEAPEVSKNSLLCRLCKKPLVGHHWNTSVDIFKCENKSCVVYLQPQGTAPAPMATIEKLNQMEMATASTGPERGIKVRSERLGMLQDFEE